MIQLFTQIRGGHSTGRKSWNIGRDAPRSVHELRHSHELRRIITVYISAQNKDGLQ